MRSSSREIYLLIERIKSANAFALYGTGGGSGEPTITAGTTAQYWRGDKTWQTLNKASVGLANVDNTSDADKPVSTLTATALSGKAASSHSHAQSDVTGLATALSGKLDTTHAATGGTAHANAVAAGAAGFMTGADKTKLDAISGTNTGDETTATIKSKLSITTLSGSNTGDQTITLTGDATGSGTGSFVVAVVKVNGVTLAGLATGLLKNTTATGVPSIAAAGTDYVAPGGALGTPSSGTLTSCTGLPIAGVSSLQSELNLKANLTSPALVTPSLSAPTFGTAATVTSGTNAQGQGALTADFNTITTNAASPGGVTLPTATAGRRVIVKNKTANPANVYPATGGAIDAGAANAAIALPAGAILEFNASTTTLWESTTAAGNQIQLGTTYMQQGAQTSKAAAATLTIAELLTGIIQYTGAVATLTLPTGTLMDAGVITGLAVDRAFEFVVVNTSAAIVTIAGGVGSTLVGAGAVAAASSGRFRARKTAANTFTVYRV